MPRKPKPKNQLSAGQRAALYLEEQNAKKEENLRILQEAEKADEAVAQKKEAKVKPKPQHAVVRVDMSTKTRAVNALHGMCNGPVSLDANLTELFKKMSIPYVRNCGWDTYMSKYAFDVSRIFKNPDADESKPESYDFSLTDKYMMGIYGAHAECIYSFGDSDPNASWAQKSPDKWARVCAMIIKHYNEYWANGFCYGINKFEISPMGKFSAMDDKAVLFSLYDKTAREIKLICPDATVGGMSFDSYCERGREFLRFCSVKGTPIDFLSFEYFGDSIEQIVSACEKYTAYIVNLGLDACVFLSAWNYIKKPSDNISAELVIKNQDGKYSAECKKMFDAQRGVEGAAFCLSLLLALGDVDRVKYATYFDAQPSVSRFCGLCDRYGNPEKPYYAFCAYSELAKCSEGVLCISEQNPEMRHSGVYARAGLNSLSECVILISGFDGCQLVDLRLDNIPDGFFEANIYMSDGVKNMELCDTVHLSGDKKRLLLSVSAYGYALIKIS